MIKLTISWYLNQKNNKQKHRPFEKANLNVEIKKNAVCCKLFASLIVSFL